MAVYDLTDREIQLIASALKNRPAGAAVEVCQSINAAVSGEDYLAEYRRTVKDYDRIESRFSALAGQS